MAYKYPLSLAYRTQEPSNPTHSPTIYTMDSFSTNDMSTRFASGEPDYHDNSTPAVGLLVDKQYEDPQNCTNCIIA